MAKTTFHVKINNGVEQIIKTRTGVYKIAAWAALAQLEYDPSEEGQEKVEIWVPELLPDYGSYVYYCSI